MKVIAIIGSPRKGNTYRAIRRIEENMKTTGDVEFEYLWLKDAGLANCKGCTVCFPKGEQRCPLKDGRAEIEQKMLAADGVIFASPNYVSNVSGLMKTFIDRFAYAGHPANGVALYPKLAQKAGLGWKGRHGPDHHVGVRPADAAVGDLHRHRETALHGQRSAGLGVLILQAVRQLHTLLPGKGHPGETRGTRRWDRHPHRQGEVRRMHGLHEGVLLQ
jgi:hypothetical protein